MTEYDALWSFIQTCLPTPKPQRGPGGRPRCSDQNLFNGMMHVLRAGCRWKDMPREFGSSATAHRRFQEWTKAKVFERAYVKLIEYARERGHISLAEGFIDGTFSPAKKGRQCWTHKTRKRQQDYGHLRCKRPADSDGRHIGQST